MSTKKTVLLDFEKPIADLYVKIEELKKLAETNNISLDDEVKKMEDRARGLRKKIFASLSPDKIVKVARHADRPTTLDYINLIFTDFMELHGDRLYGDDPSLIGGFACLGKTKVMVMGHQKGKDTKDKIYRNFGMSQPEGYRKALRLMRLANKFNLPIITLVDTPGAFPGIEAEERGQAEAIARNLYEMSALGVPVITVITGEGGSGGALGIAVANEVLILEYGIYSVISPEGCAAILWSDASKAADAAKNLKLTAPELKELKIVDDIIKEPLGGAHNNHEEIANTMKTALQNALKKYRKMTPEELRDHRYNKFRCYGFFEEISDKGDAKD